MKQVSISEGSGLVRVWHPAARCLAEALPAARSSATSGVGWSRWHFLRARVEPNLSQAPRCLMRSCGAD